MGVELSALNITVPKGTDPAIEHLIDTFDDAFYSGSGGFLCGSVVHGRGLDEADRRDVKELVGRLPGIDVDDFINRILSGTKSEIVHTFKTVWIQTARDATARLFSDLLDIAYANIDSLSESPATWAGDVATQIVDSRSKYFPEWLMVVCEDTPYTVSLESWKAPKFVIMAPLGDLPYVDSDAWDSLDVETSVKVAENFSTNCHVRVIMPLRQWIGEAELDWAKQPKPQATSFGSTARDSAIDPVAPQAAETDDRRLLLSHRVQNAKQGETVTTEQAAIVLGVSTKTINRWVTEGRLGRGAKRGTVSSTSVKRKAPKLEPE